MFILYYIYYITNIYCVFFFSLFFQDVIDLRSNAWKPRRDINAPKTIAEIHEDVIKNSIENIHIFI